MRSVKPKFHEIKIGKTEDLLLNIIFVLGKLGFGKSDPANWAPRRFGGKLGPPHFLVLWQIGPLENVGAPKWAPANWASANRVPADWAPADWTHLGKVRVKLSCSLKFCMQIWQITTIFLYYIWMQHSQILFSGHLYEGPAGMCKKGKNVCHGIRSWYDVGTNSMVDGGRYAIWIYVLALDIFCQQSGDICLLEVSVHPLGAGLGNVHSQESL